MEEIVMKDRLLKYSTTAAVLVLSSTVLIHVYFLSVGIVTDQVLTFWLPILLAGFLTFYATITFKSKFPLILILIFALSLHLIQFVRQPPNMVWNPDAIYALQLVNHVEKTGQWIFGFGTGQAFDYSFYPLFYVFQSVLSSVTSISSELVIKYSMAFLNLVTLFAFYALINGLFDLDSKSKNLIVFMFSLNPMFHAIDSYAHAESYAIIFYPLILLYLLRGKKLRSVNGLPSQVIGILLLVTISMSHHWSSYLTAFSILVPTLLLYLSSRRLSEIRPYILMLVLALPLVWLMFVAPGIFTSHIESLSSILSHLSLVNRAVGYSYSSLDVSVAYYPSQLSMQLTLLGYLLLGMLTLAGLLSCVRKRKREYIYFAILLFLFSSLAFLLLFGVDWSRIAIPDVRYRIVEYAFFPISFFAALGILAISERANKIIPNRITSGKHSVRKSFMKVVLASLFIVVFVPATIFNSFPRFMYDITYQPIQSVEFSVAPEQQHFLGLWVSLTVNFAGKPVFTGSTSAERYIAGYEQFQGTWSLGKFNITTVPAKSENSMFYVVNIYNLQLPDSLGRKLNISTLQFLDEKFNRIYDNCAVNLYEYSPHPSP